MRKGLKVSIVKGKLIISIPIKTLAWAFEHSDDNTPYDEDLMDYKQDWRVVDVTRFAEDVSSELTNEGEDGSTPLTDLLDKMCHEAVENGSQGVEEDGRSYKEIENG